MEHETQLTDARVMPPVREADPLTALVPATPTPVTCEQVARTIGVSRWRVLTVAAGLGISRKSGPKPQITIR